MKSIEKREPKSGMRSRRGWAVFFLVMLCTLWNGATVFGASYGNDYRYWSQGGSDYYGMRQVGCLITAQAKLLYETNVIRDGSFNPDVWYNWLLANGHIASSTNLNMKNHNAPAYFAGSRGKDLSYLGYWKADDNQLWYNINAGYYTIVNVKNHFVLIDNALSKQTGKLYCYDSFSDRGTVSEQLLTRYSSSRPGGHVYKSNNNNQHSHNYSATVTKQPTCTQQGVKTYRCSCGSSYTEGIASKGHSMKTEVVGPTMSAQGYTLHKCANCSYSYKEAYVSSLKPSTDGWYYCNKLPSEVSFDGKYEIQYRNYYENIRNNSPGDGWTNAGVVKDEWQNSGNTYTSETDLPTSDSRVLVRSVYYHFCGPNAGNLGNYAQEGKFVHYDEIAATSVIARRCGIDNGHPYYVLDWNDGGGRVWCKSGVTCNGAYGSHGVRCQAWYKINTYQNRVRIQQYKYSKTSDWLTSKDAAATSVQIRFRVSKPAAETTPSVQTKPSVQTNPSVQTGGTTTQNSSKSQSNTTTQTAEENKKPVINGVFTLKLSKTLFVYNGKAQKPNVTVMADGKVMDGQYYSITYKNNKNVGTAEITVKGKGTYQAYTGKAVYRINPKTTTLSGVKSTGKGKLTVKWKQAKNHGGYEVQYSTNKGFENSKIRKISGSKKTSAAIGGLQSRKTYYVRIRTYKKVGTQTWYSTWSKARKAKIR